MSQEMDSKDMKNKVGNTRHSSDIAIKIEIQ